jgi:hypothetical protein
MNYKAARSAMASTRDHLRAVAWLAAGAYSAACWIGLSLMLL